MITPLGHPNRDMIPPGKMADMILLGGRERGELFTNLKLQKLLYYAQAWFLALYGKELFSEDFEAWVHGPVLPSQYHRFKHHNWHSIDSSIYGPPKSGNVLVDRHMDEVLNIFGAEPAGSLEVMTHREQPWIEARHGLPSDASSNRKISKGTMKRFYGELAKKNK